MNKRNEAVEITKKQRSSSVDTSGSKDEKDLVYKILEDQLVQDMLAALGNSPAIADAVKQGKELIDKKVRLMGELDRLRSQKTDIVKGIEELKLAFGAENSIADMGKLKQLSTKLDTIDMAIPLLEDTLRSDTKFFKDAEGIEQRTKPELYNRIKDAKDNVRSIVFPEMKAVQQQLQEIIDEKTEDILLTFTAYTKAISRIEVEQKVIPQEIMSYNLADYYLPKTEALEGLVAVGLPGGCLRENIRSRMFRKLKRNN